MFLNKRNVCSLTNILIKIGIVKFLNLYWLWKMTLKYFSYLYKHICPHEVACKYKSTHSTYTHTQQIIVKITFPAAASSAS